MYWRLTPRTYRSRVVWEDGPGSLQNIVEDVSIGRPKEWQEPDETPKEEVIRRAQGRVPYKDEYDDSWIEHSYWLECRKDDSSEWRLVTALHPKDEPDMWDGMGEDEREE